jgi:hypothetical protein
VERSVQVIASAWATFTTSKHLSAGLPIYDLETLTRVANSTHLGYIMAPKR